MKFKKFRDLVAGDRFLNSTIMDDLNGRSSWEVAADTSEPLDDDKPDGLWKVYTNEGRAFAYPDTTVTVED